VGRLVLIEVNLALATVAAALALFADMVPASVFGAI
jgi:hypothetical protein